MDIPQKDIDLLRELAEKVAMLSDTQDNKDKIELWNKTTELDKEIKPAMLVHLWPPVAWSEALPESYQCEHPKAQKYERNMQERIWTFETLYDDSVIEPVIHFDYCVQITPYEQIGEVREYAAGDEKGEGAAKYHASITDKKDIDKIEDPARKLKRWTEIAREEIGKAYG